MHELYDLMVVSNTVKFGIRNKQATELGEGPLIRVWFHSCILTQSIDVLFWIHWLWGILEIVLMPVSLECECNSGWGCHLVGIHGAMQIINLKLLKQNLIFNWAFFSSRHELLQQLLWWPGFWLWQPGNMDGLQWLWIYLLLSMLLWKTLVFWLFLRNSRVLIYSGRDLMRPTFTFFINYNKYVLVCLNSYCSCCC